MRQKPALTPESLARHKDDPLRRSPRVRLLQAWWRFSRPATLGVRGVVTDDQGRALLVRHTYTPGWHFPGGGVERGETCVEAVTREIAEEAGVALAEPPVLVSVHANHAAFPNDHVLVFRAGAWRPTPPANQGEIAEIGWFAPASPPADTSPGTRRRLAELFAGVPVSETW